MAAITGSGINLLLTVSFKMSLLISLSLFLSAKINTGLQHVVPLLQRVSTIGNHSKLTIDYAHTTK